MPRIHKIFAKKDAVFVTEAQRLVFDTIIKKARLQNTKKANNSILVEVTELEFYIVDKYWSKFKNYLHHVYHNWEALGKEVVEERFVIILQHKTSLLDCIRRLFTR